MLSIMYVALRYVKIKKLLLLFLLFLLSLLLLYFNGAVAQLIWRYNFLNKYTPLACAVLSAFGKLQDSRNFSNVDNAQFTAKLICHWNDF